MGHLARFGSFTKQGEVLCTQGLAYLLQAHSDARSVFAVELSARAGVHVSHDLTWLAEQRQESDNARPDLEGSIDKIPVVKVEAKLGAAIDRTQFISYVGHLQNHLQARRLDGVLVVLVPRARTDEATREVKEAFGLEGPGPWRAADHPDVTIVVVSWDHILGVLERVESERFRGELEQFNAMYQELSGSYIEPLAGRDDLVRWRERRDDFIKLVDQVTRDLTDRPRVLPKRREPQEQEPENLQREDYELRYVCQPLGDVESCFSIGVRDSFEGFDTPIWLRFHRATPGFRDIRERIESSDIPWTPSGGHIWIPLVVPFDADAEEMVRTLVADAENVRRIAYPKCPGSRKQASLVRSMRRDSDSP